MIYDLRFSAFGEKNLKPKTHKLQPSKGFSLVEMIVALGLFTVIMFVMISVLASVSSANEKARTLRIVIDNLNFAVENMARTTRVGSDYYCGEDGPNCLGGATSFVFKNIQKGGDTWTGFKFEVDKGAIYRSDYCIEGEGASFCLKQEDPDRTWLRITAPEIIIEKLLFFVKDPRENDGGQAQLLIITSGTAGAGRVKTTFNIQTTITQRLADS